MAALNLHRTLEHLFTLLTNLTDFELLNRFEGFFNLLFLRELWIVYSSPPLFLSPLKILLLFPSSLIVGPVMKVNTTVSKRTVARVMPIFTEAKIIIESAGVSYCTADSAGTLNFPELILSVNNLVLR